MAFASITKTFRSMLRGFIRNDGGNMTMIMGLASIPVIAAAGMAIDYARISRVHDEIQLIADGAALAAAGAKNLTGTTDQKKAQRVAIATNYLTNGLARVTDIDDIGTPSVVATSSKVTIEVDASVKGSLINVLDARKHEDAGVSQGNGGNEDGSSGGRTYDMTINSEASWNDGMSYLCILVLNESDSQSLEIQGTADIYAPNCAVWVNSNSNSGLYENGTATLTAKKICVRGNYHGTAYYPNLPKTGVTDCPKYADPLATKFGTDYTAAYADAAENGPVSCTKSAVKCQYNGYNSSSKKFVQATYTGNGTTTIQPGIYDGGIQVKAGHTLKLAGGTYFIMNGKFEVQQGTVMNADSNGVTIIMTEPTAGTKVTNGTQARIDITAQSTLNLKAPSSGYFAGIVLAQHPNSITNTSKTNANSIIGGGTKSITGIVYYPTNILYITGGGTGTVSTPEKVAVDDPLFAIVTDKLFVEGNGQLRVGGAADNEAAGLPALPSQGSGETIVSLH